MTPQEKKLFASMITLFGVVREQLPEYAGTKPADERRKIAYAADKVDKAMRQLFGTIWYERTEAEKKRMEDFVKRSKFYVLGPQDEEMAEALAERERAWLESVG